jgi:hypothetical protein
MVFLDNSLKTMHLFIQYFKKIEVLNKWEEMMAKAVALRTRSLFVNGKV